MTRPAPLPSSCSDDEALQYAVASFPSGVTVVTTVADGEPYGMTVSAFCALSQEPPLVLLCVGSGGRGAELLARGDGFCVNVLAAGQAPLARHFASRRRPRGSAMFESVPHRTGGTGAPVLRGTVASVECALHAVLDGGDHAVVLGRVLRAVSAPHRRPLVVHRRALTSLAPVSGALPPPLTVVRP